MYKYKKFSIKYKYFLSNQLEKETSVMSSRHLKTTFKDEKTETAHLKVKTHVQLHKKPRAIQTKTPVNANAHLPT